MRSSTEEPFGPMDLERLCTQLAPQIMQQTADAAARFVVGAVYLDTAALDSTNYRRGREVLQALVAEEAADATTASALAGSLTILMSESRLPDQARCRLFFRLYATVRSQPHHCVDLVLLLARDLRGDLGRRIYDLVASEPRLDPREKSDLLAAFADDHLELDTTP